MTQPPTTIPKIIHQLWIGDLYHPPLALMETWRKCAVILNAEYILWNEEEIRKRGVVFECQETIDIIPEINGKADIMRWEILLRYGGIFIDADSICVETLLEDFFTPNNLLNIEFVGGDIGFSAFENETVRKDLIATGTMGFTVNHPLVIDIVEYLKIPTPELIIELQTKKAWYSVGPGCITRFLETHKYKDNVVIFPSHYFIPIHYTTDSINYNGHQKVYAHQLWGTGEQEYRKTGGLLSPILPDELTSIGLPSISILINSYNTPKKWVRECLESIQNQKGRFIMELIWINDGSNSGFTEDLCNELEWFKKTTRFISDVKYHKMAENVGTRICIDYGIKLCSNELIIKMDADDIMFSTRIEKQINFMNEHIDVICCGGQLIFFNEVDNKKISGRITNHPIIITEEHTLNYSWFMNHPTLCYRKWAIELIGGYGHGDNLGEDRELEVKIFNKFGVGSLYNLKDILILYRIHPNQLSYNPMATSSNN